MTDVIQGSPEWRQLRCGQVTASNVSDVMAGGKGITRDKYMARLIIERMTGVPYTGGFTSASIEHGALTEAAARMAYSFKNDIDILEVGYVPHPRIAMSGASPDGLIGENGGVEFKCPDPHNHLATILGKNPIGNDYMIQMQWGMACTERKWWDFNSFDPRFPEHLQLHTIRVPRDDKMIADLERGVRVFIAELESKIAELNRVHRQEAAA